MSFFRGRLGFSLADRASSKHTCFAADLLSPRPPFAEIAACRADAQKWQTEVAALMASKKCPVRWLAIFVDLEGAWLLTVATSEQQVSSMRAALVRVLTPLPAQQRHAVEESLRPLDELHRDRAAAWKTVDDLRPKEHTSARDHAHAPTTRPPEATQPAPTVNEFLEQCHSDSESEEEVLSMPQTIVLHGAAATELNINAIIDRRGHSDTALARWIFRAQNWATVVVISVGERPELTYIRCHREERRHLLLTRRMRQSASCDTLAQVVELAAQMAMEGSLPKPTTKRRSEFLQRCVDALREVSPRAETEVTKLSACERHRVKTALARLLGEGQPEGCLNEACTDEQTVWVTREVATFPGEAPISMSTCSRCGCPKSYNRTWDKTIFDGRLTEAKRNWGQLAAAGAMLRLCPSLAHTQQDAGLALTASTRKRKAGDI